MNKKRIVAVIPARMASTRFPGKPLAKILNLAMIEHVRRRVCLCDKLSKVIVATCDKQIKDVVEGCGGNVVMTSHKHQRCTDRVAEAAQHLDADIIVNIQGDEPFVMPEMISAAIKPIIEDDGCGCVNLISPIESDEEFRNPNSIKTVVGLNGNVLYFSREPIPSSKNSTDSFNKYKQLGIIAFTKPFLVQYAELEQTPLEKVESIDMMRLLENGYPIKTTLIDKPLYGVDTPEELRRAESLMKKDKLIREYI